MSAQRPTLAWNRRDRRLLRGFMALTGLGLIVPGVIYLSSLSDTLEGIAMVVGRGWAPLITGGTIAALLVGGLTFIIGRGVRQGSVLAAAALVCGSLVHHAWSSMMMHRMEPVPAVIPPEQRLLHQNTILFAANGQIPHIIKNTILLGVCVLFFCLAPRVCGGGITKMGSGRR